MMKFKVLKQTWFNTSIYIEKGAHVGHWTTLHQPSGWSHHPTKVKLEPGDILPLTQNRVSLWRVWNETAAADRLKWTEFVEKLYSQAIEPHDKAANDFCKKYFPPLEGIEAFEINPEVLKELKALLGGTFS